jgi:long-chain fatty acid transport protein
MRLYARWFVLVGAVLCLVAGLQASYGAGFGLYEGSARGNALGGTLVGRADDPSALYYNPAGITQLSGLQVMGGATVIRPSTTVETMTPAGAVSTETEENDWVPPHLYGTYQVADSVWAGVGLFSRFGLGTEFPDDWPGRFNNYDAEIQTLTFNPDVALRINDQLSVAAGVNATWFDLTLKRRLPNNSALELTGDAIGYGYNAGVRYEPRKWIAFGASYQSEVEEDVDGTADLHVWSTDASGDITLPDEILLGVVLMPTDKLSLEVGAVRTGWSSYDQLSITFDDPSVLGPEATSVKDWNDVWRYQFGVEYKLSEQFDLRLGYVYDEEPSPGDTVDYLVPANDRQLYSAGCGYHFKDWTFDLSYTYLMIRDRTVAGRPAEGILPSEFTDGDAHMLGVSVSAKL